MKKARETIERDPDVRELVDLFGAEVIAGSIKPRAEGENGD